MDSFALIGMSNKFSSNGDGLGRNRATNNFKTWISEQDWEKLKFMDEVHFVSGDVARTRALGPVGESIVIVRSDMFDETYSVSCLCSLDEEKPLFITGRQDSNDQADFFEFVLEALLLGYLKRGDFFICDNARIHGGFDTIVELDQILECAGVTLIYLPAYSPELNPCELIFMIVKRHLRENRMPQIPLRRDIAIQFTLVTHDNIKSFYNKCIPN